MKKMNLLNPFIISIKRAFHTLTNSDIENNEPYEIDKTKIKTEYDYYLDIAAVIALSGEKIGSLALAFKKNTAIAIASKLMNENYNSINKYVEDVIGEIANTIAGNIKEELKEYSLDNILPVIIAGSDKIITFPEGLICYNIDFKSQYGDFKLCIGVFDK